MNKHVRSATVEILEEGEKVLGSPTNGQYMVRRFEDGIEMGGEFFYTLIDAQKAIMEWGTPLGRKRNYLN